MRYHPDKIDQNYSHLIATQEEKDKIIEQAKLVTVAILSIMQ